MNGSFTTWTDEQVDRRIGRLLQWGVTIAAVTVAIGGIWFLANSAQAPADHRHFDGEPESLRDVGGILAGLQSMDARAMIQFGLLLLILTPIARVAFTVVAFVARRDFVFVGITLVVLSILLATLLIPPFLAK
ncbi:MAG TPA: DUF1634 domain-containing protein [Pirellulales bacterium]|jgi:uncharacterized membrane protein